MRLPLSLNAIEVRSFRAVAIDWRYQPRVEQLRIASLLGV